MEKKVPKEWCDQFRISITEDLTKGFGSIEFFDNEKISKREFCNRIVQCKIVTPLNVTRADAAKMKKELFGK